MYVMGWLIIFIVLIVIELITMGLTTIWFAGGALAALLLAYLGLGLPLQIGVFLVVSVVMLLLTRPIAVNYFNKDRQKTNAESLIGQQAVVLDDVDTIHAAGRVEVNGMEWSAKTADPEGYIPKNSKVIIEGIQGVKLIVKVKEDLSC